MSGNLLRPQLYDRLCRLFGRVEITAAGETMVSRVLRTYDGSASLDIDVYGETYRVNCPFCKDTRKRLYINHRWGLYDDRNRNRNLWLAKCHNEDCLRDYQRQRDLYRDVFADVGDGSPDVVRAGVTRSPGNGAFSWPGPMNAIHHLPDEHAAASYLRGRGFDLHELGRHLKVGYCIDAPWEYRMAAQCIIVPIYRDGKPVGWQARFIGEPASRDIPKYYTMPTFRKSVHLYNYDAARLFPFVVVCEGVTDVWRVGANSVALFGKTLSQAQKLLIGSTWGQGIVVILLDGDAVDAAKHIHDALKDTVRQRVLVKLPDGKDPGELRREELDRLIREAARDQGVVLPKVSHPVADQATAISTVE